MCYFNIVLFFYWLGCVNKFLRRPVEVS